MIFAKRVTRKTPGRFRTRVITKGVIPSIHIDYKHTRIKQYHKLGQALRTETTINDTRDFGVGKRLHNLGQLREIGFCANRRLLDVQRTSSDCYIGEEAFAQVCAPVVRDGQRGPALRFGDLRMQTLLSVLVVFRLGPNGFSSPKFPPAGLDLCPNCALSCMFLPRVVDSVGMYSQELQ